MSFLHLILRGWRQRPARTLLSIASVAIAVAAVLGTALAQSSVRIGLRRLSQEVEKHPALEILTVEGRRLQQDHVPALADIPGVRAVVPIVSRAGAGTRPRQAVSDRTGRAAGG